jgi:cytochrome c556
MPTETCMPAANAKTSAVAIAVVVAMTAGAAGAATIAQTIATRQAGYKEMGKAFKAINDELKKPDPDLSQLPAYAKTIRTQSLAIPNWFPKGSGPESGVKTKAKADIWAEPAKFTAAQKALQVETAKLQTAVASKNIDAIKAQVRATGGACKSCHDSYRAED